MLLGKAIKLRQLQHNDESYFFKWRNDLDYIALTKSVRLPKHEGVEKEWFDTIMRDKSNKSIIFIIETIVNTTAVGFVQLNQIDWISRNCFFGVAIPEKGFQGKGIGKESMQILFDYAFNILNLKKISLEVVAFNKNSIHLYEKIGFEREGTLKHHYFWNGDYHDVLIYSLFMERFVGNESK